MMHWATILLLVIASYIFGRALAAHFLGHEQKFDGDRLEFTFLSLILGIVVEGWLALVLVEFGIFSFGLFWGLLFFLLAILLVVAVRRGFSIRVWPKDFFNLASESSTIPWLKSISSKYQYVFLALWLIIAGWLFFRPHQYILGAADAGVYVNLAANVSETGGLLIDDPFLEKLDRDLYPAFLRRLPAEERASEIAPYYILPAFFVSGSPAGRITPQFYPLHTVWMAIAHNIAGLQASLLMTGVWAILGGLAIYLTTREIAGWEAAVLALIGLSINALQVWFARYPTTETLTQFLLWAGLWSTMVWLRNGRPQSLWGLVAGLTLGELFLVRIDTYFLLVIPLILWLWLRWTGRWRHVHWWFFAPIGLLSIHSIIHAVWQSRPYFFNIYGYGIDLIERGLAIVITLIILTVLGLMILSRYRHKLERVNQYRRLLAILAIIVVIGLILFGWFIRPNLGGDLASYDYWYGGGEIPLQLDRENLLRLGWYLSPLGIALATGGICLMIWQVDRKTMILLLSGFMFSLLYLWRAQANPHQIYVMRRYVPAVMPFAIVAAAYFIGWLVHQKKLLTSVLGAVLALLWIFSLAWSARGFINQIDFDGIVPQFDQLDDQLISKSILIFNDQSPITAGDFVGTPLHFLYGHDVYSLRDPNNLDSALFISTVEKWQQQGRDVYWVGDQSLLNELGIETSKEFQFNIKTRQLEGNYERKPVEILDIEWFLEFALIE